MNDKPTITVEKDTAHTGSIRFSDTEPPVFEFFGGSERLELKTLPPARGERRCLVAILLACIIVLATALAFAASALLETP